MGASAASSFLGRGRTPRSACRRLVPCPSRRSGGSAQLRRGGFSWLACRCGRGGLPSMPKAYKRAGLPSSRYSLARPYLGECRRQNEGRRLAKPFRMVCCPTSKDEVYLVGRYSVRYAGNTVACHDFGCDNGAHIAPQVKSTVCALGNLLQRQGIAWVDRTYPVKIHPGLYLCVRCQAKRNSDG